MMNEQQSIHPAEPDPDTLADASAGDGDARPESLRHPPRGVPTPSYIEFRNERAASGGLQKGASRNARQSVSPPTRDGKPDLPPQQPAAGSDPAQQARPRRGADFRRYRGTPHGFRAEPGPAAREGEPLPQRSDATVTQDVHDFLMRDGLIDLEALEVRVHEGHVELHGRTRTGRGRYQAAELAQHVAGVVSVTNCLEVTEAGADGASAAEARAE
jgi:hypothetical protein